MIIGNLIGIGYNRGGQGYSEAFISRVEADGGIVEAEDCLRTRIQTLESLGMMQLASAVWLPHGYKEGKLYAVKGGANADLSFSRNGTRTRKGPTYVEQVPYNLLKNSKTLSTAMWGKGNVTITDNAITAPDGTLTGSKIELAVGTATKQFNQGSLSLSPTHTLSFHVKYGTNRYMQFWMGASASNYANIDLVSGTLSVAGSTTGTITSANDGWYKVVLTLNAPSGNGIGFAAIDSMAATWFPTTSATGNFYIWAVQLSIGTSERDHITTTDRFNVPALDYTSDSSCPALSLEPARTNLLLHSEDLTNAAWVKTGCSITANDTAAPDNLSTADRVVDTGTGMFVKQVVTVSATTTYTFSTRVKKGNKTWMYLSLHDGVPNGKRQWFNLDTGAAGSSVNIGAGLTTGTPKIRATANGFYELEWSVTTAANTTFNCIVHPAADGDGVLTNALSDYGWFWGSQLEAGSYATSYIPTTTATVSRVIEMSDGLLAASLIGQTEGTIYFDCKVQADGVTKRVAIDDNTPNNRVLLHFNPSNQIELNIMTAGIQQALITSAYTTGDYKIAIIYRSNYAALFVNGVKIGEDLSVTVPACSYVGMEHNNSYFFGDAKAFAISKTAISDAQAIALTA